jgi:hypothetical protein
MPVTYAFCSCGMTDPCSTYMYHVATVFINHPPPSTTTTTYKNTQNPQKKTLKVCPTSLAFAATQRHLLTCRLSLPSFTCHMPLKNQAVSLPRTAAADIACVPWPLPTNKQTKNKHRTGALLVVPWAGRNVRHTAAHRHPNAVDQRDIASVGDSPRGPRCGAMPAQGSLARSHTSTSCSF